MSALDSHGVLLLTNRCNSIVPEVCVLKKGGEAPIVSVEGFVPADSVVGCKIPRKENSPIFFFFSRPPLPFSPGSPEVDPMINQNRCSG